MTEQKARVSFWPNPHERQYMLTSNTGLAILLSLLFFALLAIFLPGDWVASAKRWFVPTYTSVIAAAIVTSWSLTYRRLLGSRDFDLKNMEMMRNVDDLARASVGSRVFWLIGRDIYPLLWSRDHPRPHFGEYGGLVSYFKDILERFLSLYVLIWVVFEGVIAVTKGYYDVSLSRYVPIFFSAPDPAGLSSPAPLVMWLTQILRGAFIVLAVDAVIQIADLIESPGIGEVIEALTVTITAYVVFVLSTLPFAAETANAPANSADATRAILTLLGASAIVGLLLLVRVVCKLIDTKAHQAEDKIEKQ
jgi:hypothetical protein